MLNTPVLFLVFNRLETTKQVFAKIQEAKPIQLFIAADGARIDKIGEQEKVEEVRKFIIDNIDWDCEVKTLFRKNNLGCGKAVSEGITWFFEHVEQGIILEDDCLPEKSFFFFCQEMLEKYKMEQQIASVCGTNHLFTKYKNKNSYYFSNLGTIWGWATWRRVWNKYNFNITEIDIKFFEAKLKLKIPNQKLKKWIITMLTEVQNKNIDTWDIQWLYTLLINDTLSIISCKNLVKNIGYVGTHTENTVKHHPFFNMQFFKFDLDKIEHPNQIKVNSKMDSITFKAIVKYSLKKTLTVQIKDVLKKIIPKFIYLSIKKYKNK
ncbi:hypothetical protein AD998_05890 [bacterium 336/3]|nr:hypothetical protein AD998_05890 [bacterium 336/3]